MSFGFFAKGTAGNLILGDGHPVLTLLQRGSLVTTGYTRVAYSGGTPGYSYCTVSYPTPVTTSEPPLVFGFPNGTNTACGIGMFSHLGGAGRWTGFRVMYVDNLFYGNRRRDPFRGVQAGWDYAVCVFGQGKGSDQFGLRLFDEAGNITFDSGWPIVPFRSLLRSWVHTHSGRKNSYTTYFGNWQYNQQTDNDWAWQAYRHVWGARDGDLGILISSLCNMSVIADNGLGSSTWEQPTIPIIGFESSDRSHLTCSLAIGPVQHAGTNGPALNGFGLLTADFTRV